MAANISGLHQFADDVGPLPLKLLDDSYSTLSIALNTLSTFSNFYQDQGTTNAYTIQTTQFQFASYTDGLQVTVRIANTNTGMSTLNVNGLGAKHILTAIGTELQPNALVAGSMVTFIFNAQRDAWQISDSGASGQITAPLHITNATGQAALSINPDGSGYLGDFNGNGLSWDGACNFTFEGGATLSGIKAPFAVTTDTSAGLYYDAPGGLNLAAGDAGSRSLDIFGAVNADPMVAQIHSGNNTVPGKWIFWVGANDDTTAPGCSFGEYIMAGTNANDISFQVVPLTYASVTLPPYEESPNNTFLLRGDRTGAIGPAPNQLVWDTAGNFTLTGTATLPMPPLIDLPGITITNPQNGEALVYDQATNSWVNGAPVNALAALNDVVLTNPLAGQTLTYNGMTQRWVNSPPVLALEGLVNTHISGPAPGQVLTYSINPTPGWVNATIPGYNFLSNLGVGPNPAPGWVLTWDGQAWVGAAPGEVATFPLSSLTDVGITTPLNRQVLTYDAPSGKWINAPAPSPSLATLPDVALTAQSQGQVLAWDNTLHRWVNSSLPGGSVIALDTLMDTNISDPQNNEVLTWDYASARWVNRALPFIPVLTTPSAGQILSYNGTSWVNSAAPVSALAGLSDVALASPTNGQMLVYDGASQRWANSNAVTALTVNAPSGQQYPLNVYRQDAGVFVLGYNSGSGAQFQITEANSAILFNATNAPNGMALGTATTPRVAINNSGNVVINAPSAGVTLVMNGGADQPPVVINGQGYLSYAVFQRSGAQIGSIGAADGLISGGAAGDFAIQASNGFDIATAAGYQRFIVNSNGNVIINVPSAGPSMTVNTLSGQMSVVLQSDNGITNGVMWQQLGRTQWQAIQDGGTDSWRLWNQNSGTVLAATNTGNVSIGTPSSGTALSVQGRADNWAAQFRDPVSGVKILAGSGVSDPTLLCVDGSDSLILFRVNGNGSLWAGNLGSGTGQPIIYAAGGQITIQSSTARFKRDIRSVRRQRVKETIAKLRTVSYRSTCEADDPDQTHYGLIAEEVAAVDPCLVYLDKEGQPVSVAYDRVAMLLLPLMQELLGMDEPEGEVYG